MDRTNDIDDIESVAKKMFQTSFLNEYGYFKWVKTAFLDSPGGPLDPVGGP